ncbi:hypothetical protein SteCoe_20112 [Stentor coeruleus]|uniref:PAS domain-containing protein n=1 Tax=Stentor coeruleus TaxID=5963 RepID=A0A1R2BT15_9CILI|nr:hypothetical protein SteCoe_20112 [Stentor coeruleus]
MVLNIYSFGFDFSFRNSGVENKYLQQTNLYFKASLKILLILGPIIYTIQTYSILPILLALPMVCFYRQLAFVKALFLVMSMVIGKATFLSLLLDWAVHIYTIRCPSCYLVSACIKIFYWKYSDQEVSIDTLLSILLLYYLCNSKQHSFRKLWADMEINKRKMMQEKTILNEIQPGVIVFNLEGLAQTVNHKALIFLQTRGIASIEKLYYFQIFPDFCEDRIKGLFRQAKSGMHAEEEFFLSHNLESIMPLFSTVLISLKITEFASNPSMNMTIVDIGNAVMRRRFLVANQKPLDEASLIREEEFIGLHMNKKPLKNRHMCSLKHNMITQNDILVLMGNYLGECEVINEYFDIKNEIVNTVHICWRGAKAKKMSISLICEQVIPKQVFGDNTKHNQILKSLVDLAILTGEMNSKISINCSLKKFTKGASIEYKVLYYSKSMTIDELGFIFRIRKHFEQPKLLEEMIEISEKYGLGVSIFDVLLTITGGYVSQIDVQDNIYRVIISYILNFENTKDTENPLRGICLFKKKSDGISYIWGKQEKLYENEPVSFVVPGFPLLHLGDANRFLVLQKYSDISILHSDSSEENCLMTEESMDEKASFENRSLIQRCFSTPKHDRIFKSATIL